MNEDGPRRGITFQCGLARESYGFEGKDLTALKDLACSFLDQKVLQRKLFLQLPCVFLCVDSRHIEQPSASHVAIAVVTVCVVLLQLETCVPLVNLIFFADNSAFNYPFHVASIPWEYIDDICQYSILEMKIQSKEDVSRFQLCVRLLSA